ncbi:MAG: GNAT family N-acetyltransferase, partial [Promicromonosporaceae bacterium]|nr:GNAT family N-acetyltransferase [Promicromonosporaceae bacterium]
MTDTDAAYPLAWEADVVLRDGTTTHVRPIRPADADALQRFQVRQSERSSYFRFFAPVRRLSDRELAFFTHVDHTDRVALVAVRPDPQEPGIEDIIGVARYDVVEPGLAEVAFNIADSVQGIGLGALRFARRACPPPGAGAAPPSAAVL